MIFLPSHSHYKCIVCLYYMQLKSGKILSCTGNRDPFNHFIIILPQLYNPIKINVISRQNTGEKYDLESCLFLIIDFDPSFCHPKSFLEVTIT